MSQDPQQALRDSFPLFLAYIFSHLGIDRLTTQQKRIAKYLQHGSRRRIIMAFRGIGKSYITAAYALWLLYRDPQLHIGVISANKLRAENQTKFMLSLIHAVDILAFLRPSEQQRERADGFDVGPKMPAQTPSVFSVGVFGNYTGQRADIIIADDVEVPKNTETVTMREKLAERVREFSALLRPEGPQQIIYLGTPQCEDTLYAKLIRGRGYDALIIPAQYPDDATRKSYYGLCEVIERAVLENPSLVGAPTDPERFDSEVLESQRLEYGPAGYSLQFMLNTALSDAEIYPLKLRDLIVLALDDDQAPDVVVWKADNEAIISSLPSVGFTGDHYHRGYVPPNTSYSAYSGTIMAVDPSGRGKDETGYAVVSAHMAKLYLRSVGGVEGNSVEDMDRLLDIAVSMGCRGIFVEPNYGGGSFTVALQGRARERGLRVGVQDAEWAKGSKGKRIGEILRPVVERHRLVVDEKVIREDFESVRKKPIGVERQAQYRWAYQFTHLRPEDKGSLTHDDRLEAVSMAVQYWMNHQGMGHEEAARRADERAVRRLLKGTGSIFDLDPSRRDAARRVVKGLKWA